MRPKILVIRNDKLGDFMLAWPALALIKSSLPGHEVHTLVPEYTFEMAELCPYVDRTVLDPGPQAGVLTLEATLTPQRYSAMVTLFSTTRVGVAAWLARIPVRVAPATKLAQIFYNHRLVQRRSQSLKPEHEYNTELARFALAKLGVRSGASQGPPYLRFDSEEIRKLRARFVAQHNIPARDLLVFVHPGSGGSAQNLSLDQYAQLTNALHSRQGFFAVIAAGPGELEQARSLSDKLIRVPHVIYESTRGLAQYARHIAFADVFISGSTGPLHIAGALNRPTVGFYPRRRSSTALRWQTLSEPSRRLAFSPPQHAAEENMACIDIVSAAREISGKLLHEYQGSTVSPRSQGD